MISATISSAVRFSITGRVFFAGFWRGILNLSDLGFGSEISAANFARRAARGLLKLPLLKLAHSSRGRF